MKLLLSFYSLLVLLMLTPFAADAGVRVSMSDNIDLAAEVVIDIKIRYAGLHGYHHKSLDPLLLKAGESKERRVLAVPPVLYESVYANAFHPAYYIDSTRSNKIPMALRTVQLPVLEPRSWDTLLQTGEPLQVEGVGITAGAVNDHFRMVLRYFLPAFDQAGGTEDLRKHLPLLDKLAVFAHTPKALENILISMRRYSSGKDQDKFLESTKRVEGRYRIELMQQLKVIKAWLSLDQAERLPMHQWLNNLHKPEYVFDQVMDDADRERVMSLLRQTQQQQSSKKVEWVNPVSKVKFSLSLTTRTGGKNGAGYRARLYTDLNPRLGLENDKNYIKKCSPDFRHDTQSGWGLVRK